jgi:dUTP pyrophosphatase
VSKVDFKAFRLQPRAILPEYAKPGDSGMDVYAVEDVEMWPLRPVRVRLGWAFALPEGYEFQVRPKSGYSNRNVLIFFGTVDEGYRGEVGVNMTLIAPEDEQPMRILAGQKVAQIVIARVCQGRAVVVNSLEDLGDTERGAGGFGSTGLEAAK